MHGRKTEPSRSQEIPCLIVGWSNIASGKTECLESTVNQICIA